MDTWKTLHYGDAGGDNLDPKLDVYVCLLNSYLLYDPASLLHRTPKFLNSCCNHEVSEVVVHSMQGRHMRCWVLARRCLQLCCVILVGNARGTSQMFIYR